MIATSNNVAILRVGGGKAAAPLLLLVSGLLAWSLACPQHCQCSSNRVVACTGKGLRVVPHGIPQGAVTIDFQDNKLNEQAFAAAGHLRGLTALKKLNLESNVFTTVYTSTLAHVNGQSLRHLVLSYNWILTIQGGAFRFFPNLETLLLENNRLVNIHPLSFFRLSALRSLQLDQNQLAHIPYGLFDNTPHLRELGLSRNNLKALTGCQFTNLSLLQDLELDNNQIETINENAFAGLSTLRTIDLDHNRIARLQRCAFADLTAIWYLEIDHNQLIDVHRNAFVGLQSLRGLKLFHNKLTQLPDGVFSELPSMYQLDLHNNHIRHLRPTIFGDMTNLTVRLEGNRLNCDCGLLWLQWLIRSTQQNPSHHQVEAGSCFSPQHVHNTGVDNANIQCPVTPTTAVLPRQQTVRPGHTAYLLCMAGQHDEIRWLQNGTPLSPQTSRHVMYSGLLIIRRVSLADAGHYSCEKASGSVRALSQAFSVLVVRDSRPASHLCTATTTSITQGPRRKATLQARCAAYARENTRRDLLRHLPDWNGRPTPNNPGGWRPGCRTCRSSAQSLQIATSWLACLSWLTRTALS